jgi:hypothetical protein
MSPRPPGATPLKTSRCWMASGYRLVLGRLARFSGGAFARVWFRPRALCVSCPPSLRLPVHIYRYRFFFGFGLGFSVLRISFWLLSFVILGDIVGRLITLGFGGVFE